MAAGAICILFGANEPSVPVSSGRRRLVRPQLRRADGGAGAGLAGLPGRPARADRGAHRIRQDARGLPRGHRRAGAPGARARAQGRNPDRLRLAAQGAVERHQAQPRSAARRHPRCAAGAGLARRRYPHLGAHRRHARRRARPHAPSSAAYRGDHAGIALHPARLGIGPRHARDHPDRDRRRDPRIGAQQARHPSGALARAPGGAVRQPAAAHRPVRHAEADRGGRAFSGRSGFGQRRRCRLHHRRYRPPPRARSRARGSGRSARSGDVGRGVGAGLCSASRT